MPSLAIGVIAALAATIMVNGGSFLQSLDARRVSEHHALRLSLLRRLAARPRWLLGLVVGYLAFPVQILALLHAPLQLVQPLHAAGLLVLLAIGFFILRERLAGVDLFSVCLMIGGLVLLGWWSPTGGVHHIDLTLLGASTAGLTAIALLPLALRHRLSHGAPLALAAGLGFAGAALAAKGVSEEFAAGHWGYAACWVAVAAIAGIAATVTQMTAFQRQTAVRVIAVTFAAPTLITVLLAPFLAAMHWSGASLGEAIFACGAAALGVGMFGVARTGAVRSAVAHESGL